MSHPWNQNIPLANTSKEICRGCGERMGIGRWDRKRQPGTEICTRCWNDTQRVSLSETYPSIPNVEPSSLSPRVAESAEAGDTTNADRQRRLHASLPKVSYDI